MLGLGRPLRGAIDHHLLILARHRQRNLSFQIKMLLTAKQHTVREAPWCLCDGFGGIAALQDQRRRPACFDGRDPGSDAAGSSLYSIFASRAARRACSRVSANTRRSVGRGTAPRRRQNRVVILSTRRNIVRARNILCCQHIDHTRRRIYSVRSSLTSCHARHLRGRYPHVACLPVPACRRYRRRRL